MSIFDRISSFPWFNRRQSVETAPPTEYRKPASMKRFSLGELKLAIFASRRFQSERVEVAIDRALLAVEQHRKAKNKAARKTRLVK